MRRILVFLVGSLLSAALWAAPCAQSPTALCLNDSRFEVEVSWRDSRGRTGVGQAVPITADTGYFWFFSEANIELVVKVLDARTINNKFWVFFGALSSVEYDLVVTDTVTGAVKTYHNTLGQFASVGDTGAFSPAPPAIRHETQEIYGTLAPPESLEAVQRFVDARVPNPSPAFTRCTAVGSTLGLNDCRFALHVEWTDSRGRTGRGIPVQLTNDTGYFWFFNENNIELVVKILDARSLNGSFWVFYGALSSVQYTLTVTDSLSGAVRTYTNPSGSFASVGDTGAFRGGRSVAPVADTNRATFADVDANGGSISATASDGTQFILELPPDALADATTVRMTPLERVDHLPLSRGLIGGVRLEPEGLRLFAPATLRIRRSGAFRPGAVAFSYQGTGQEFALEVNEVSPDEMSLPLFHFSGYGGGQPGSGDVGDQQSHSPADPAADFRQRAAEILERGRIFEDENFEDIPPELTPEQVHEQLTALLAEFYEQYLLPTLRAVPPVCNHDKIVEAANLTNATLHTAGFLGLDREPVIEGFQQAAVDLMVDILRQCLEKARQDCIAFKDPFRAWEMVLIARQLEVWGGSVSGLLEPGGPIEDCLRFKLHFVSTATLSRPGISESLEASADVPLRIDASNSIRDVAWSGSDEIALTHTTIEIEGCTTTGYDLGNSEISVGNPVPALLMPLAFAGRVSSDPEAFTNFPIRVGYDPGFPTAAALASCSGVPTQFGLSSWRLYFEELHAMEHVRGGGGTSSEAYLAERWEIFNLPGIFARKTYQGSKTVGVNRYTDETEIIIEHTPHE